MFRTLRGGQELGLLLVGLLSLPVGFDLLDEVLALLLGRGGGGVRFQAGAGQGVDRLGLQPVDELFAQHTAQLEQSAGVRRGDDGANPDRASRGIHDLEGDGAAVPQVRGLDQTQQLDPHGLHGDQPVQVELDDPRLSRFLPAPVLEGFRGEQCRRHDPASFVPAPQHHIGEGDFLDGSLVVVRDDDVADAQGTGEGDLESGEDVRE